MPIVRPIRELDFIVRERGFVADCFFVIGTEGVLLPITVPIFRLLLVRSDDRLLFALGEVDVLDLDEVEGLVELTAGCLAPVGAEELRVPIDLPIRERGLVVGCFFVFERDGVLRLIELPIREAPLERAAGCFALLGTDGLVVLIVLPIREVLLGLIRLLALVVDLLVVAVRELFLLDVVLGLIRLPIRDVMLGLILLLELLLLGALLVIALLDVLLLGVRLVIALLDVLLLGARLLMDLLDVLLLGVLLLMALLELLLLGVRLLMDLLDVLLLGVRLVMDLLDVLLLGARLIMDLLELLLLGARLLMDLLELLLLGVRLLMDLLELLLLGVRLAATLLELLDLLLLDRVLAARTGSENNKRANKMQETKKSGPF